MYKDLSLLTGMMVNKDNVTASVVKLIKNPKYKKDLLNYRYYIKDKRLLHRLEDIVNDNNTQTSSDTSKECSLRFSFKEWLGK